MKKHNKHFLLIPLSCLMALTLTACTLVLPPETPQDLTLTTSPPPQIETSGDPLPPGISLRPEVDYTAQAEDYLKELPEYDFEESSFLILTARKDLLIPSFDQDTDTGRAIDVEIQKRNQRVEAKHNVRLLPIEIEYAQLHAQAKEAVTSSLHLADMIELPQSLLGKLASDNLTVNMKSLPFTDYTKPYFNKTATDQCSAGYTVYAVVGNANRHPEESYCLFFRSDKLDGVSAQDLYTAVYRGEWTWDALLTLAGNNTAALAMHESVHLPKLVLASANLNLLQTAYGTLPEADPDFLAVQSAAALTAQLMEITLPDAAIEQLKSGDAAFYIGKLSEHSDLKALTAPWGILPLPKLNAKQAEYATMGAYQTVTTVLRNTTSPERSGTIVQALNAASTAQTTEALIKEAYATSVQHPDAANVIALFADNLSYDFGYMMQDGYDSVRLASVAAYETAVGGSETFSKLYRKQEANLIRWNPKNFKWD